MYSSTLRPHVGTVVAHSREPVSLRRLFPGASFVGCGDIRVFDATERAEECVPGMLFAARLPRRSEVQPSGWTNTLDNRRLVI